MLWVEQFQWTSRAAVCAQLIEFLNDTPPSPPLEDQPLPLTAPDRMAADPAPGSIPRGYSPTGPHGFPVGNVQEEVCDPG